MTDPVLEYDVAAVRAQFPSLRSGVAHFDGPGGTQTPESVGRAIHATITGPLSNAGELSEAERNAAATITGVRRAMADLLGADPRGVIVGRSMTQLTMDLARTMSRHWGPGDEVVVSRLDHDGNVRPWVIAAAYAGAAVRWADFDPVTGELTPDDLARVLSDRTRVVAVTGASNLIGTIPDLPAITALARSVGAWSYVDAVHRTAHTPVDQAGWGADFVACSPYKFLGPHCGVVAGRPELLEGLHPDKLAPSTDRVPERFELGTPAYELLAGVTAAVEFLADIVPGSGSRRERLLRSMRAVARHEDRLRERLEAALIELPGATIWSRAAQRTPTLLATFADFDAHRVAEFLAARGVNAPAGSFYAYEPARRLGLGERGGLRMGLAPYTDDDDVDRLIAGLRELIAGR